ncbi:CaiB/BaiF CoA transferase family protein [Pseudomonas sp. NFX224]|uniref:CaiB/BaiF CoA transferase family protein n=1 Tax=Pseudomonas sp. NFX224 TaxID=3402862 RepID=UPI003AFA6836
MNKNKNVAQNFEAPLTGVKVLDLVTGPMGAIGRQLVELGAEVIRVEPRAGGADRLQRPLLDGVSLAFVAFNMGKKSVALDFDSPADCTHFEHLLAGADILISPANLSLAQPERLRDRYPHLVTLALSGYGRTTSIAHWQYTDPVLHALSGELSRSGIPGRTPLLPPGELAFSCASAQAAYVLLLAYYRRLTNYEGDYLDFSILDGAVHALDPGYGIAGSATAGVSASKLPRGRPEARFQYPIIPCKDGYVRICVLAPRQWQGMFQWLGEPEAFADPAYATLRHRFTSSTLIPAIAELFADKTRVELEVQGQAHGVPVAAVLTLEEALACDQIAARGAVVPVQISKHAHTAFPNGLLEIDGVRAGIRGNVACLGEHQRYQFPQQRAEAGCSKQPAGRPLEGLRVLDLGVIVVGAEQGRLLADQGAEVIKLENSAFPDGSRQSQDGAAISVTFAAGHRNKKGLGLNLRSDEGKVLFRELVKTTDVILSNFKPGTLDSLGLGYKALKEINPALIMVDSSAFGPSGPWSERLGYGPLVRASSGLTAKWQYAGEPGSFSDALTVYPDHVAARIGVTGVLALLIRRLRTEQGGTISVSQLEVMLGHMSVAIAGACGSGKLEPVRLDAPWGVFPCKGDDDWCVVTVRHDDDWRMLCDVIARPDLAADPQLASPLLRASHRTLVDEAVSQWLMSQTAEEAMRRLQEAGVPAGAMLRVSELPTFPYFRERAFFRPTVHPLIGEDFLLENAPVFSRHLPDPPDSPAPLMGEHSEEILTRRLGLSTAEIARLVETGAVQISRRR